MTVTNRMALTVRSFLPRLALAVTVVVFFSMLSRAGGPNRVAGTTYFDSSVSGQPLTWPQGIITYYTDQGDLSPVLLNGAANSLVADAFSQWTSIPTAAVEASSGGQLAEDVNGTNVTVNADGSISMPSDIQASATGTPVGIVYDYDGSVTDALLGSGAGDSSLCFTNAAYGGSDNYGALATYQHALIVLNGQCAQQPSQTTDLEYRLVRVIGSVLGLGWSQLNANVLTGNPPPTSDDYAGFPVMHFLDSQNCAPVTRCFANPYQPTLDDSSALSRLYPVTAQNQSSYPGKKIFSSTTARIHGSVWFTDAAGNRTQPMQGVNVVARLIDPGSGQASRRYALSSVSGFLFSGNEGNPITGFSDPAGDLYSEWGSTIATEEGFFDLAGLPLPSGGSAQYLLTVEPIDTTWFDGVGPYAPLQVAPSGSFGSSTILVIPGQDVQHDILMTGSALPIPAPASGWSTPGPLPQTGDWVGSLGSYGTTSYFLLPGQANRTLSIAVTALDESGNPSESKMQPVIGMWAASDPQGTAAPAFTPSAFNTATPGLTRLDALIGTSTNFLVGIADYRGDGRPDYHYHAQVLYADSVSPTRVGVSGGPVTLRGIGFKPGLSATIAGMSAAQVAVSPGQIILDAPVAADGPHDITLSDPVSGSSTTMTAALNYGALTTDNILLLTSVNPSTPVGAQAPVPIRVQVVASDGVTPVAGATVGWSATNGLQLSACGGAPSCTVATDQSGNAMTWLTPGAVGVSTITATLAPGVYSPPKSVSTTLNAVESASDIGVMTPFIWIAQGATVGVPLTARVLSNGTPQTSATVNFTIVAGSGSLSASSSPSDSNGFATVTLSLTQMSSQVEVSACVAPANAPCQIFYLNAVPLANLKLQPVSGVGQISAGSAFQPLVVRVTDTASPPNSVLGAPATFQTTVFRPGRTAGGGTNPGNSAMPVVLSVNQATVVSDINGLVSILPSAASFGPPVDLDVAVTAGVNASLDYRFSVLASPASRNSSGVPHLMPVGRPRLSLRGLLSPGE